MVLSIFVLSARATVDDGVVWVLFKFRDCSAENLEQVTELKTEKPSYEDAFREAFRWFVKDKKDLIAWGHGLRDGRLYFICKPKS